MNKSAAFQCRNITKHYSPHDARVNSRLFLLMNMLSYNTLRSLYNNREIEIFTLRSLPVKVIKDLTIHHGCTDVHDPPGEEPVLCGRYHFASSISGKEMTDDSIFQNNSRLACGRKVKKGSVRYIQVDLK